MENRKKEREKRLQFEIKKKEEREKRRITYIQSRHTLQTKNKFSFWESVCFKSFICNKSKKEFAKMVSLVIDRKISVENILKLSNNIEMLKELTLDEDDYNNFHKYPPISFEKQLKMLKLMS